MTFQNLEYIWQHQALAENSSTSEEIITKANSSLARMRRKQNFSMAILAVTSLVLILFYLDIEAYKAFWSGFGLLVMIFSLVSRIGLELYQNQKLRNINPSTDFQTYLSDHNSYFKQRQWVHFGFTPLVYLIYFGGFWMMLPAFKASLSSWFYTYILISGSLVFVGLAVFIGYHIKKELQELKFFKDLMTQ